MNLRSPSLGLNGNVSGQINTGDSEIDQARVPQFINAKRGTCVMTP